MTPKNSKKIRVSIMGVVNDSQIPDVIREKSTFMKHPTVHTLHMSMKTRRDNVALWSVFMHYPYQVSYLPAHNFSFFQIYSMRYVIVLVSWQCTKEMTKKALIL